MDVVATGPFAVARLEINPGRSPSVLRIMVSPPGNSRFLEMLSGLSNVGLHDVWIQTAGKVALGI